MAQLISFDIDGTLVTGDGPGPITLDMVRRAIEQGHIVGSASDRPVANQKAMWELAGITPQFTVNKHLLDRIRSEYDAESYIHIGDTEMDKYYAELHGFEFVQVQTMDPHPWMLDEHGHVNWGPFGRASAGAVVDGPIGLPNAAPVVPADAAPKLPANAPKETEYDYLNG